jgi:hephaestin
VALVATGTLVSALGTGLATGSAEAGTGHTGHATAAPATGAMTGDSYWQQVGGSPFHPTGTVRTYYLGADEVAWDYAPTGRNPVTGKDFDDVADVFVKRGPGRIGSTYLKCLYRQYTDATFTTQTPVPAADAYLG